MLRQPVITLRDALLSAGKRRGWAVWDRQACAVTVSHPALNDLRDFLTADKRDFLKHEAMFFEIGQRTKALMGAFIWNTRRGQVRTADGRTVRRAH